MRSATVCSSRRTRGLLLVAILLAVPAFAASPQVVKAIPDNGATDVDPGLKEIQIEFDQDMRHGGYSFCGGGDNFPKLIGKPRWKDDRTVVWRVRLQPDHEYAYSINCPAAQNFVGVNGSPATPYPISFTTAAGEEQKLTPALQKESVDELRRAVDECYSYRDLRGVDWGQEFARLGPKLAKAKSRDQFARYAGRLLAKAEDIHIWLKVGETLHASHRRKVPPNGNFKNLPNLVPGFKQSSAAVFRGRYDEGKIGYIMISSWETKHEDALDQAFVALDDLRDCDALIIDMRFNSGGSETLAQEFAGCFIDKPVVYAKHVYRDSEAPGGFSKPHERVLNPTKGRPRYRGRIAVLTGPYVMSSAEGFLLMMKAVPNCTLVGANSYGSSGNPKPYELPNEVVVYLPSWKSMGPDGKEFEGSGIAPDVAVETSEEDFHDGDPVLDKALELLRAGS